VLHRVHQRPPRWPTPGRRAAWCAGPRRAAPVRSVQPTSFVHPAQRYRTSDARADGERACGPPRGYPHLGGRPTSAGGRLTDATVDTQRRAREIEQPLAHASLRSARPRVVQYQSVGSDSSATTAAPEHGKSTLSSAASLDKVHHKWRRATMCWRSVVRRCPATLSNVCRCRFIAVGSIISVLPLGRLFTIGCHWYLKGSILAGTKAIVSILT
jgi:hypothetical protein